MNEQTDRRTKGHVENIMRPSGQSGLVYEQIQYMFAVSIAFLFYDAERVLSSIA